MCEHGLQIDSVGNASDFVIFIYERRYANFKFLRIY